MSDEPEFPILDGPQPRPSKLSYALPPEEQRRMALLANHLAKREAEMPLRRRMQSWLEATGWASLRTEGTVDPKR